MPHRNAHLTETGRLRLARCVGDEGWPLRRAAERFQVSPTTAQRWAGRYRELGEAYRTGEIVPVRTLPMVGNLPVEHHGLPRRRAEAAVAGAGGGAHRGHRVGRLDPSRFRGFTSTSA